jgi:predicted acetyltransferase
MDIAIRQATEDDWPAIARNDALSFGVTYTDEQLADNGRLLEFDRFVVAVAGDDLVGAAGAFSFELTLPGGEAVPAGGLTWVSVAPTHRRRGILNSLMAAQFADAAARREPVSLLFASQGGIYGRFGYGPAVPSRKMVINRRQARLRADVGRGEPVRFVSAEEARRLVPDLWDRYRVLVPGALARHDSDWDFYFLDRESWRGGLSARFWVVHPDGYVTYRVDDKWDDGFARHRIVVLELAAATDAAYGALWRLLLDLELVEEIEVRTTPLDEPLPWLLDDPRQVRTTQLNEGMWARLLDPGVALGSRRYGVDDALVLDIADDHVPAAGGRWRIEGGPDGAACESVDTPPDVSLGAAALGSILLGGHRPRTLARAGLIHELSPGALRRADAFFAAERLPNNTTHF